MKVLYIGDFSQPWHTESHVASDLERLGHEVERQSWRHLKLIDPDVVIVQGGGLPDGSLARAWLSAWPAPTIAYHLDVYAGLPRAKVIGRDAWWECDVVCTADGSPAMDQLCRSKRISHRWVPAACVSSECEPGEYRRGLAHDVVFVGGSASYPHLDVWPWRRTLVGALRDRYGSRFAAYPSTHQIRGSELNDLFASSKVVVGDSLHLPGMVNYWSDRYYETVGRGGFLVAPRVSGIEQHFTDGEHLALYEPQSLASMFALVDRYLEDDAERERISKAGQAHVRENHTYIHRAERLLELARPA